MHRGLREKDRKALGESVKISLLYASAGESASVDGAKRRIGSTEMMHYSITLDVVPALGCLPEFGCSFAGLSTAHKELTAYAVCFPISMGVFLPFGEARWDDSFSD